jgi:LacI family transcriptional regulator
MIMANHKNITIKDIARMSGVSAGTVDRVLHNRGRVSKDALDKVVAVLNQIDYKPNLLARSLGSKRNFRIAVVVPDPDMDPYWRLCSAGIRTAEEEWGQYGVKVEPYFFDLYDSSTFTRVAQQVSDAHPDGVLMAPIFHNEALRFFDLFREEGTPYVLFNTNIHEANPLCFIGQDLYQSGRVGGELMSFGLREPATLVILHTYEDFHNSVHLEEKEKGFRDYFTEQLPSPHTLITIEVDNRDGKLPEESIRQVLSTPNLKGIFSSTSSGTALIAAELAARQIRDVRLIGYDLLDENLKYLQAGYIDFLINQNPKHQAFTGISHLANHLLFKKNSNPLHLFPLEVITRQNLTSYQNSSLH